MAAVRVTLEQAGGVLRRRDLLARGISDWQISVALRAGEIVRARQGWFAVPGLPDTVMRALSVGGFVAGMAALESYGVWIPGGRDHRILMARNASRFSRRARSAGAEIVWGAATHPDPTSRRSSWRAAPLEAFAQVLSTCDRDTAIVLADSMLRAGLVTADALREIFANSHRRTSEWFELVDARADAGGETMARLWLGDACISTVPQFVVPGAGPFDLRVSARGLLEIDGRAHHDSTETYLRDREKDLRAAVWGFDVLRITYAQLERQWPDCLAVIRRWHGEHGPVER